MVSESGRERVLSNVELTEHGVSRSANVAQHFWDCSPELYLSSQCQTSRVSNVSFIISLHMFASIAVFPELTHMCASSLSSRMLRLAGNHTVVQHRMSKHVCFETSSSFWLCVHTDKLVLLCVSV